MCTREQLEIERRVRASLSVEQNVPTHLSKSLNKSFKGVEKIDDIFLEELLCNASLVAICSISSVIAYG